MAEAQTAASACGCDPDEAHLMDGQYMVGHRCSKSLPTLAPTNLPTRQPTKQPTPEPLGYDAPL
jgi:hypothetical protein